MLKLVGVIVIVDHQKPLPVPPLTQPLMNLEDDLLVPQRLQTFCIQQPLRNLPKALFDRELFRGIQPKDCCIIGLIATSVGDC